MSLPMALVTFFCSWWIMLFFVLPFYIRPNDSISPLEYQAAPQPLRWGRVLLVNLALSLLVVVALALATKSGWFHMDTMV